MSSSQAALLGRAMREVVSLGSGGCVRGEAVPIAGKSGTAELHAGAASTDVTVEIQGTSDLDPIYVRSGTCDAPGAEVVHDIGFTTANLGQGQIFVPINEVATGEFILTIEDDKTMKPIMCGVIPAQ